MAQMEQEMSGPTLSEKLDQLIGEVAATRDTMSKQTDALSKLTERMVLVESETKSTKEVVEAWGAAKTWLRWSRWIVGFVASAIAAFAAYKGISK